jgi:hypothetical protein
MLTGKKALTAIDRYMASDPCIEVITLENIYEMLFECRMAYGVQS